MRCAILHAAMLVLLMSSVPAGAQVPPAYHGSPLEAVPRLERQVAELLEWALDGFAEAAHPSHEEVIQFYQLRSAQPAWMSVEGTDAARVFVDAMAGAEREGLEPDAYPSERLGSLLATGHESLEDVFAADVELTAEIVRFATHLAHGVEHDDPVRATRVPEVLQQVSDGASARAALERLAPRHHEYESLRSALATYRAIADGGGWRAVPDGPLLRPGDEGDTPERIMALCQRLAITGDIDPRAHRMSPGCDTAGGEAAYDEPLVDAVRTFQARHGLLVDGVVGPQTIAAMNVPVDKRIEQIEINMNRWRRLPDHLGPRHVHVNIPAFRLEAVDNGQAALAMRVVAGERDWQTPVMIDEISYLEFSPYWNVPDSITNATLLPQIASNPAYLRQQNFEVIRGWSEPAERVDPSTIDWASAASNFPYRLRQRPGPTNAMGLVKFMFPNEHAVYLHDTPAEHRFEERRRAFSHGCVRVEDPIALAEFLLQDPERWTIDRIERAMQQSDPQVVNLDEQVPVYLSYFTAWVEEGAVHFRQDIYGLDARPGA